MTSPHHNLPKQYRYKTAKFNGEYCRLERAKYGLDEKWRFLCRFRDGEMEWYREDELTNFCL